MSLPDTIRNVGSPVTEGFGFTRAINDPDLGTATFVGAAYTMTLNNDSTDTTPDISLTVGNGITVTSESADASEIKIVITAAQLQSLHSSASPKPIPDDPSRRKGVTISYTLQMTQAGYEPSQGADSTPWTGKFYLVTQAEAGR